MKAKITKRMVDQLVAGECDNILWDSEIKGFGVRCRQSGAKHYMLKMRVGGRQRWLAIGRHGSPWTPETARAEALRLLGIRAAGHDPAMERDRRKGATTVAHLGERFLSEYLDKHCKPRTAEEYRRAVEKCINPALGRHLVPDLTRADIARFHHKLRDRPYQANRALAVLSKMMNLAEQWGLRPNGSNPTRHVRKYREAKRERYLSMEELHRLGETLAEAQATGTEGPFVLAAIALLVLTGARLTEILNLRWAEVDLERQVLRLPDSKTGAKTIYLNDATINLLKTMPRLAGNPYVIPGAKKGARLVNLQKPWRRLRARAELNDVRIHDLRHSLRYAHLAVDPLRAASNLVGTEISAAMTGKNQLLRSLPDSEPVG